MSKKTTTDHLDGQNSEKTNPESNDEIIYSRVSSAASGCKTTLEDQSRQLEQIVDTYDFVITSDSVISGNEDLNPEEQSNISPSSQRGGAQ